MYPSSGEPSLIRRIVAGVVVSLGLILSVLGAIAYWTIQEAAQPTYQERLAVAQVVARSADADLRVAQRALEFTAAGLELIPEQPLTDGQRRQLAGLSDPVTALGQVALGDAEGRLRWPSMGGGTDPTHLTNVRACVALAAARAAQVEGSLLGTVAPPGDRPCVAVAIRDNSDRVIGTLVGEIQPLALTNTILSGDDILVGMYGGLVDEQAMPIGTSGGEYPTGNGHHALLREYIATRTAGYAVHGNTFADELAHLVFYAPLPNFPGWGVAIEQPRDVVLAVPRRLATRLALMGLASILIAAAVAWIDVRRVVQPLRVLIASTRQIAAGDLQAVVPVTGTHEVAQLGQAVETVRQRVLALLAEVARWNHELEERVAARTAEIEARNRELVDLNTIARTVTGSRDATAMLEATIDLVLAITGSRVGAFLTCEPHSTRGQVAAERNLPPAVRQALVDAPVCPLPTGVPTDGEVPTAAPPDAVIAAGHAAGLHTLAIIPLPSGGGVHGTLFLGSDQLGDLPPPRWHVLSAIGSHVGLALDAARLYEAVSHRERERAQLLQQIMVGQEEERRRLARELHDDASQALASLRLGLERLANSTLDGAEMRRLAGQLHGVAAQTLDELHRLVAELRPSVLDDVGWLAAIQRYVAEANRRYPFTIEMATINVSDDRLLPAAETVIYRIVQGSITNVVQHARASHVSVVASQSEDKITVVIEDDGTGFDLNRVRSGPLEQRLGLAGADERAGLIGATLTIETAPGAGTTVYLEVPLTVNRRNEELGDDHDSGAARGRPWRTAGRPARTH